MIPTSGVRQLHYVNLCIIAAFINSTKKYDAFKWYGKFLYDIWRTNRV